MTILNNSWGLFGECLMHFLFHLKKYLAKKALLFLFCKYESKMNFVITLTFNRYAATRSPCVWWRVNLKTNTMNICFNLNIFFSSLFCFFRTFWLSNVDCEFVCAAEHLIFLDVYLYFVCIVRNARVWLWIKSFSALMKNKKESCVCIFV
jgi:hypothetical protein